MPARWKHPAARSNNPFARPDPFAQEHASMDGRRADGPTLGSGLRLAHAATDLRAALALLAAEVIGGNRVGATRTAARTVPARVGADVGAAAPEVCTGANVCRAVDVGIPENRFAPIRIVMPIATYLARRNQNADRRRAFRGFTAGIAEDAAHLIQGHTGLRGALRRLMACPIVPPLFSAPTFPAPACLESLAIFALLHVLTRASPPGSICSGQTRGKGRQDGQYGHLAQEPSPGTVLPDGARQHIKAVVIHERGPFGDADRRSRAS